MIKSLVQSQQDLAVDSCIACTDADGPSERIDPNQEILPASTFVFKRSFSERWKYSRELGGWLSRNVASYDLVHIHSLWSYPTQKAAREAARFRVPYILRPAGMLSPYSFQQGILKKRLYWMLFEGRTVRRAAAFHATTEAEKSDIDQVVSSRRVYVIPNGIDDLAWASKVKKAPASEILELLLLARLHPVKGIVDLLLPAISRIDAKVRLTIAGGSDPHHPSYEGEVVECIKRLGLQDRVRMVGPVKASEKWQLIDQANLLILPSHSENFGLVVAEAMARARPVLVTDRVQISDFVSRERSGIVVSCEIQEICEAIQTLISDPSLLRELGSNGRKAAEKLRWHSIADQTIFMYREIIRRSKRPS